MTFSTPLRCAIFASLITPLFLVSASVHAQQRASNVPAGIQISRDLGLADPSEEINITVHFQLPNKAAFDKAVDALYNPASPTFHKWMTNADLSKYAPPVAQRQAVRDELERNGLTVVSTDRVGFTMRSPETIQKRACRRSVVISSKPTSGPE